MQRDDSRKIELSPEEEAELEAMADSGADEQLRRRARIVLAAGQGWSDAAISRHVGASRQTVAKWRFRYWRDRVEGLTPSRPRPANRLDEEKRRAVLDATLHRPPVPVGLTLKLLSSVTGVSVPAVHRILRARNIELSAGHAMLARYNIDPDDNEFRNFRRIVGIYNRDTDRILAVVHGPAARQESWPMVGVERLVAGLRDLERDRRPVLGHRRTDLELFLSEAVRATRSTSQVEFVVKTYQRRKEIEAWAVRNPAAKVTLVPRLMGWSEFIERWFQRVEEATGNAPSIEERVVGLLAAYRTTSSTLPLAAILNVGRRVSTPDPPIEFITDRIAAVLLGDGVDLLVPSEFAYQRFGVIASDLVLPLPLRTSAPRRTALPACKW